ncbi:hypothetical protein MmTuc01_3457 [Methanosarcina mazei Tuc01]|uniref:RelE/StbE replicon stabilization toxin n=1 Tax=Methanosarcina mazei Tuc01 TaxID=1236903 RepID=M1Q2A4_METMZ|nr:hypothetical protein MmTuc01_3457 [Methanosarcina mazei Tuc01]
MYTVEYTLRAIKDISKFPPEIRNKFFMQLMESKKTLICMSRSLKLLLILL